MSWVGFCVGRGETGSVAWHLSRVKVWCRILSQVIHWDLEGLSGNRGISDCKFRCVGADRHSGHGVLCVLCFPHRWGRTDIRWERKGETAVAGWQRGCIVVGGWLGFVCLVCLFNIFWCLADDFVNVAGGCPLCMVWGYHCITDKPVSINQHCIC